MIISLDEAKSIDATITEDDILALESAVRSYTNNKFRRVNYKAEITAVSGNSIKFDAPVNLFLIGNSVEIVGASYIDGFYIVRDVLRGVGIDSITVDLPFDVELVECGGYIYQLAYPADVKAGARQVIEHKLKMAKTQGIKSKSISRMTVTYDTPDANAHLIFGVSVNQFDFMAPYMKMGWN